MDTDVLVVGAGPTGLLLIIDKNPGPVRQTRALGVQARTLEIYAHLGIAGRALELGKPSTGANMWARGRRRAWVPFGDSGRGISPYPYILILGQDDNERLLGEVLRTQGIPVAWNTELLSLSQLPDRVVAKVRQPDGSTRELAAAWVAGCDGARSSVRTQCAIEFQGAPYEHVFYVADTEMTGPMVPDELNVYVWDRGFHLFFPMRGDNHWRVVGILPPALQGRDDLTLDELMPSIRAEAGAGLTLRGCSWFSTYRIHHRRAQRFREGRCFVLGDAAHIHSPVGAQGMNTGLQDAYNLAWKLALVAAGKAPPALLDTYGEERLPVAERLLSTTDRFFTFVVSESRLNGFFRTHFLPRMLALVMRFQKIRKSAFRTLSQIGIRYRQSRLSLALPGLPEEAPRAGDRFPWLKLKLSAEGPIEDIFGKLDDTRFTLVQIGQAAPAAGPTGPGGLLRALVIPSDPENERELARSCIPSQAFYLVRPDGYIAVSGARLDMAAVLRYASERLGVSGDALR
jgi:2-polyprenyl-6-methoxyphenol hydroxylase-like FAD-dependent oxidoreductase